jgi:hypothetical protein
MASTLASSAVDGSSSIGRVKQKIMNLGYIMSKHVNFQWDDDEVHFVLAIDQRH